MKACLGSFRAYLCNTAEEKAVLKRASELSSWLEKIHCLPKSFLPTENFSSLFLQKSEYIHMPLGCICTEREFRKSWKSFRFSVQPTIPFGAIHFPSGKGLTAENHFCKKISIFHGKSFPTPPPIGNEFPWDHKKKVHFSGFLKEKRLHQMWNFKCREKCFRFSCIFHGKAAT